MVLLRDEKVGLLDVRRNIQKSSTEYKLESLIEVDKIINMRVEYRLTAKFTDGALVHSNTWQRSNQKININTTTQKQGDHYLVEKLNKTSTVTEPIDYNLCTLYFQEPVGRKKLWSDSYGQFVKIRPAGIHRYELLLPDGKKNYYTYNYGICTSVETEQLFSKINFRLIPNQ